MATLIMRGLIEDGEHGAWIAQFAVGADAEKEAVPLSVRHFRGIDNPQEAYVMMEWANVEAGKCFVEKKMASILATRPTGPQNVESFWVDELPVAAVDSVNIPSPANPQYVACHIPGPQWNEDLPAIEQDGIKAHFEYLTQYAASGQVALGGPFLDRPGGMLVFRPGLPRNTVEHLLAEDPAVVSGLVTLDLRTWLVTLGAEADALASSA